jgi:hypothetical protein
VNATGWKPKEVVGWPYPVNAGDLSMLQRVAQDAPEYKAAGIDVVCAEKRETAVQYPAQVAQQAATIKRLEEERGTL